MKPRKPFTLTVAAATLLAAGFSPSASAELTTREASIVPIAAFTANGNQEQLKKALAKGLDNGLTVNEIKAVLEQMYAYTGFPRSLTALGVYVKLLDERKASGLKDNIGRESTPLPQGTDLYQIGTKTQTELVGHPVAGPVYTFSPNIDTYLKDHLFGAIFANDVLNWRERELATVSALAALPAPAQLRSHLKVCMNVGLSPQELSQFADELKKSVGKREGKLAQDTLKVVLEAHRAK